MALKIRLRQQGRNNLASYRIVVTDERSPRDGKYLEALGWYNPLVNEKENQISTDAERIQYWVSQGAQVSENVEALLRGAAPAILKAETQRRVAKRAKALSKRKARAQKSAK